MPMVNAAATAITKTTPAGLAHRDLFRLCFPRIPTTLVEPDGPRVDRLPLWAPRSYGGCGTETR
jgi:hypothetical protein